MTRRIALIVLAAFVALGPIGRADVATRGRLLGIGSGEHLLWIDLRSDGAFLLHASSDPNITVREELARYAEAPEAIAAFDDRAWLAFSPSAARPDRRDVVTLSIRSNAATGLSYASPAGGAELLASLPAADRLVGFAADQDGVAALLQPSMRANAGAPRAVPRLVRLSGGEWKPLDFPDGVDSARWTALTRRGEALALLGSAEGGAPLVATLKGDRWSIERLDRGFADATLIDVAQRAALVAMDGDDLRFAYLRLSTTQDGAARMLDWARMAVPSAEWLVAGTDRGAVILDRYEAADGQVHYERRLIAPIDTEPGPRQTLVAPGFSSGAWIHVPLLAAIALASLMGFLMMRTVGDDAQSLPPALSLERRAIALFVDLLPGAILAVWLFAAHPLDLLSSPSWSLNRSETGPAVVAIIITCLHSGLSEAIFGRSLGKAIVGGVVVSGDGSPAKVRQVFVRGLFKFLTLSAPILAIFVLFTKGYRSIGDVLSRTIVANARDDAPARDDAQK